MTDRSGNEGPLRTIPAVTRRCRILLITRNMPPLVGGMERLNWHLAEELQKRADVHVIAPEGSHDVAPENVRVREVPLKPLSRFLLASTRAALSEARSWNPDVVIAGSGLTAPMGWLAARISRALACTYVHGLDLSVNNRLYRHLWLPAIRHMDKVIANSSFTRDLARQAGVEGSHIAVVHPGVATSGSLPDPASVQAFIARHRLEKGAVLLSLGRLSERKGLREFVTDVFPGIVRERPAACLVIAGSAPVNALKSRSQTPEVIQAAADRVGVGKNLRFLGSISDGEKSIAYRAADVHVFPVREIRADPEGFGMVAIEAAANGLPTVAYGTGGVVDAVEDGVSGRLVTPGDANGFARAVLRMLDAPPPSEQMKDFARRFDWRTFGENIARAMELEGLRNE